LACVMRKTEGYVQVEEDGPCGWWLPDEGSRPSISTFPHFHISTLSHRGVAFSRCLLVQRDAEDAWGHLVIPLWTLLSAFDFVPVIAVDHPDRALCVARVALLGTLRY